MSPSAAQLMRPFELQESGNRTSRTPTTCSHNSLHPVEAPNGGATAWLKVLGCFFAFVNTWGLASSFGVYQAFYQTNTLSSYSPSAISWIGTVQVFLLGFTGTLAGPLFDRGFARSLLSVGCFLVVFGLFMLSVSTAFYQILLSQGVCIGIGLSSPSLPADIY